MGKEEEEEEKEKNKRRRKVVNARVNRVMGTRVRNVRVMIHSFSRCWRGIEGEEKGRDEGTWLGEGERTMRAVVVMVVMVEGALSHKGVYVGNVS